MEKVYIGRINYNQNFHSVYVVRNFDNTVDFFDENGNMLAKQIPPYDIIVTREYRDFPPEFLTQIKSLWKDIKENNLSPDSKRTLEHKYIAQDIMKRNPKLESYYSIDGLTRSFEEYIHDHPEKDMDKMIQDFTSETLENCEHFRTRESHP